MIVGVDARVANETARAGVGHYCHELLKALALLREDVALRVYLDRFPESHFPVSEAEAELLVLGHKRGWNQRVLGRKLRRNPPDVFFAPTAQIPLFIPCPVVATIHDLAFFEFGEQFTWSTRHRSQIQTRYAVRRAQHLLAVSETTKADLIKRFHLPPEFITVTPHGVSGDFRPMHGQDAVARVRKVYNLPERYILYVGRIQPRKNIQRLIDAFATLREHMPGLPHRLVIAGDRGWMDDPIFEHARKSPAAECIQFIGYVERPDLAPLIAQADVLTLVSLWEGFGMPVVEAMASGTAVVVSNCSSLPEVVGDAGITVDPYDVDAIASAIQAILENEDLRHGLERKALERAAQFTWQRSARLTLEALRSVAPASSRT